MKDGKQHELISSASYGREILFFVSFNLSLRKFTQFDLIKPDSGQSFDEYPVQNGIDNLPILRIAQS